MTSLRGYGLDGLLEAVATAAERHPDHCTACRDARLATATELRLLQDHVRGDRPDPPAPSPPRADPDLPAVWCSAVEIVETFRGATNPAVATIVRALHLALNQHR